ncbi:hypothetical protein, partial [Priestia megaterium]|uniref:hypothetical protein n=1 Tax=Priestia megaterium TaxID=1404 RepID=UPI0035B679A5
IDGGRLGRSSLHPAHVMASVGVFRRLAVHGARATFTHHRTVVRGLGGGRRRLLNGGGRRWSMASVSGVALGDGRAGGKDQGR